MKMKRTLALCLTLVICASLAIGGTMAYLSDTDSDVNVMTMGKVEIEQWENGADNGFEDGIALMPVVGTLDGNPVITGDTVLLEEGNWSAVNGVVKKEVTVHNTGKSDAYVRTFVAFEGTGAQLDHIKALVNNTADWKWSKVEETNLFPAGYTVYEALYMKVLPAGEETAASLLQVALDSAANNADIEAFGDEYTIHVLTQAVQEAGFAAAYEALPDGEKSQYENAADYALSEAFKDAKPLAANVTTDAELLAAIQDSNVQAILVDGDLTYDWGGESYENSKALLLKGKSIEGAKGASITFKGYGSANPIKGLELRNITVYDETVGDNEASWEHGYLEFESLKADNVVFADSIMLSGNSVIRNSTFRNSIPSWYAAWVNGGNVTFEDCVFTGKEVTTYSLRAAASTIGTRGIKIHEADGTDVISVVVDGCYFELSEKPGVVIGDLNANTSVVIKNSKFNCKAGDQGKYIYESDTAVEKFSFVEENNTIFAEVDSVETLKEALANNKDVVLTDDIIVPSSEAGSNGYGATGINVLNGQTFDGNGNEFGVNKWGTWDSAINTTGGTIKNVTITEGMRGIFVNHNSSNNEPVILENVTIDGTIYTISCDQGTNHGLKAYNSTFNGWTSYAATIGNVEFYNCYFGEGNGYAYCRPYAPTEFVGCEFEADYIFEPCAAVTFENCTIGGVALTAENVGTLVTDTTKVTVK